MDQLEKTIKTIAELKFMEIPIKDYFEELIAEYGISAVKMKIAELGLGNVLKMENVKYHLKNRLTE